MSISEKDGHPLAITHSTGQTNLSLHSLKSTETNHSTLIELNNNDENKEKEKKEKKDKLPPVGIFKLYRHATGKDTFLVVLGILCAIICGVGMPLTNILFGDLINVFVNNQNTDDLKSSNPECFNEDQFLANCTSLIPTVNVFQDYYAKIQSFGIGVAVIGLATWILSYVFVTCLNAAAESQVYRIRCLFLKAILRQDVGWYDTNETGDFASKLAEDLNKLQDGMGEKVGMFIYFVTIFVSSIITAFIYGWELTLVIFSVMPVLIVTGVIMTKATTSLAEQELESYGKAGAIAEEALSAIRTVVAFGGQDKEAARYMDKLDYAKKAGIKRGAITSVSTGVFTLIVYGSCALSFWYGVKAIMDDQEECLADPANCSPRYDAQALIVVFFSVLMGTMQIGQSGPYAEAFMVAKTVAATIYSVIDRVPKIDSFSDEGLKPDKIEGHIEFRNVHMNYPSRPQVQVLSGLSFTVLKGQTVALVGSSGCGKSTCVQLIQRFYDPDPQSSVRVDGHDIRQLNLKWLREKIGVVGQEPVLFDGTIQENIEFGKENVSEEELIRACKDANAMDFIEKLPKRFETIVGERGVQLSGGQKQRIAIARALVRDPEILLLDEATSALDTHSESLVQSALEKASAQRTTVVVAHRLSTIRSADKIVVLSLGKVVEEGTHDELMLINGVYHSMVSKQLTGTEDEDASSKSDSGEDQMDVSKKILRRQTTVKSAKGLTETITIEDVDEAEDLPQVSYGQILKLNGKEWPFIVIGVIFSIANGAVMPMFAIIFGDVLKILSYEPSEARKESVTFAIYFILLGLAAGLATCLMMLMFTISGEGLTKRMRAKGFEAMLRQEIGWFDEKKNNTGALCARLSTDAAKIHGATGSRIGTVLQGIFTMAIAIAVSFYFSWKLALLCLVFVPILIFGVFVQTKVIMGHDSVEKESFENSAKIAVEAIANIRTVAGLGCEQRLYDQYISELKGTRGKLFMRSQLRGFLFGMAQAVQFFCYSATMTYGGYLVREEDTDYESVFKVFEAMMMGSALVGQSVAFAPDYNKGVLAAKRVMQLFNRRPLIDSNASAGLKLPGVDGNVNVDDANFFYPTRREVQVLKDFHMVLEAGQNVALVGPSGCGKSTCVQLLQRFYDLASGDMMVEMKNIEQLNVPWLRSNIGIVSQEPTLFDRTIAENIQYGDNCRQVTMEEVFAAATKANIHNFIANLPSGYDTMVGDRGTQLSGGQKQRIAIARALIRQPKILLLDEATSALDTESEAVVQEALERAQENTTCITIAHRLSTIKNAHCIFVIDHGKVTEQGSHDDLILKQGLYYKLWNVQSNKK